MTATSSAVVLSHTTSQLAGHHMQPAPVRRHAGESQQQQCGEKAALLKATKLVLLSTCRMPIWRSRTRRMHPTPGGIGSRRKTRRTATAPAVQRPRRQASPRGLHTAQAHIGEARGAGPQSALRRRRPHRSPASLAAPRAARAATREAARPLVDAHGRRCRPRLRRLQARRRARPREAPPPGRRT